MDLSLAVSIETPTSLHARRLTFSVEIDHFATIHFGANQPQRRRTDRLAVHEWCEKNTSSRTKAKLCYAPKQALEML